MKLACSAAVILALGGLDDGALTPPDRDSGVARAVRANDVVRADPRLVNAPTLEASAGEAHAPARGRFEVRGPLRDAWLAAGGAARTGAALEDEHPGPGGIVQRFERGCLAPDGSGRWDVLEACDDLPDLSTTIRKLGERVPKYSSRTDAAIGVAWLPTGARWSYRGDLPRAAASSTKWVWATAALARNPIEVVEPFAIPAFAHSDNVAARELIDLAGGVDAVNDFTERVLGIPDHAMSLCAFTATESPRMATRCYRAARIDNFFTAEGALTFLERLWRGDGVAPAAREKLLEWSKLAPVGRFSIVRQLPPRAQATMHQKRGEFPPDCCVTDSNWISSIGIGHTPRGPYAIVISFGHGEHYSNQLMTAEWASCVVYHALARDAADPFEAGCRPY